MANSTAKHILVVGPAWIGDMVMAQTLFKYLKSKDPDSQIDVLAPSWTLSLVERMPEVSSGIVFPLKHGELNLKVRYQLGKELRKKKYHQAIVLPGSFKSALTPLWANIPKRTGWLGEWRLGLLNDIRYLNKVELPLMIQRFVALGTDKNEDIPTSLEAYYPRLITNADLKTQTLAKLNINAEQPILALCPGAEYGPAKRWPVEYFSQIAQAKIKEGWQVLIFGSAKEYDLAQTIFAQAGANCHNLCGKTTLLEALELLASSKVVVSNDSGLMHIAAAIDRPLVVLYGSSSPNFTPPLAREVAIASKELECSPCFKRTCPLEHFNCMKQLTPQLILSKINQLVKE